MREGGIYSKRGRTQLAIDELQRSRAKNRCMIGQARASRLLYSKCFISCVFFAMRSGPGVFLATLTDILMTHQVNHNQDFLWRLHTP